MSSRVQPLVRLLWLFKHLKQYANWNSHIAFSLILLIQNAELNFLWSISSFWPTRVKKRVSERVLARVMHIIQSETLGETFREREKYRQESRQKSHRESPRESQIGLYARLLARFSPRLVFLMGCKIDGMMLILRKVQNPTNFESLVRFRQNLKTKLSRVYDNYLAQNLNFAELGAKPPFFEKFEIS